MSENERCVMTTPASGRTVDRRVARTQGALRDALLELLLERGWDATSVQDLCDRANIGRSTFYAHFTSKERLLISSFDELRRMLRTRAEAEGAPAAPAFNFVGGLIAHAHDNQRLFRAVIGKRSGLVVQRHFRNLLLELVAEEIADIRTKADCRDACAHYIAGALFELLTWWADAQTPIPPAALEALFIEATMPVLAAMQDEAGSR